MNSRKFITGELKALASQFSGVRLRYKLNALTNEHIVEVTPQSVYDLDSFMAQEIDVWKRFAARFHDEWLIFITDDTLIGIDDFDGEEYTICGETSQRLAPARRQRKEQEMEYAYP
ncbi:MAG: hypothetical protein LBF55_02345 [Prevotellaceae bacterium]|jgi:hypothetical protein|nr:hypothetical protein [Prevotellaceae bacterium]